MADLNGQPQNPGMHQDVATPPVMETLQPTSENTEVDQVVQEDPAKMIQLLLTEMQELRQDFDTKVKYDESKERQLDSMHRELQMYREGLHFKILRPLFIDLIAVHDDLGKLIDGLSFQATEYELAQMIDNLKSFQATIEDILFRNGVESYCLDSDTYVPSKQRVFQVIDTTEPAQDKQIARRLRKGFEYEGRVLRPELVATYRAV